MRAARIAAVFGENRPPAQQTAFPRGPPQGMMMMPQVPRAVAVPSSTPVMVVDAVAVPSATMYPSSSIPGAAVAGGGGTGSVVMGMPIQGQPVASGGYYGQPAAIVQGRAM